MLYFSEYPLKVILMQKITENFSLVFLIHITNM